MFEFVDFKKYRQQRLSVSDGSQQRYFISLSTVKLRNTFSKKDILIYGKLRKLAVPYTNLLGSVLANGEINLYDTEQLSKYAFHDGVRFYESLDRMCDYGLLAKIELFGRKYVMLSPLVDHKTPMVDALCYYIFNKTALSKSINILRKKFVKSKYIEFWKREFEDELARRKSRNKSRNHTNKVQK